MINMINALPNPPCPRGHALPSHEGRDANPRVYREGDGMTYPTCGTCRHWGEVEGKAEAHRVYRRCMSTLHIDDAGEVRDSSVKALNGRYVTDSSGWFAALKCREDFGCMAHEARP
jgi:hypothetical protein